MSVITLKCSEVIQALDAQVLSAGESSSLVFKSVSTDTRHIDRDALFVALQGPNFNGEDFVAAALNAGAVGVVVSPRFDLASLDKVAGFDKTWLNSAIILAVPDTLVALGQLGRLWQQQLSLNHALKKVAITGSCGKTTVKELIAQVLQAEFETLSTEKNYNNEVGVPLTLLRCQPHHQRAVLELGAGKPGDIAYSGQWVQPDVVVITNAGAAHLEGMGSLAGVAKTKGELLDVVSDQGVAVLNADDDFYTEWRERAKRVTILSCSLHEESKADLIATDIKQTEDLQTLIRVSLTGTAAAYLKDKGGDADTLELLTSLQGGHNVLNILQTVAASMVLGASVEAIKKGVKGMTAVAGRLKSKEGWQSNITLLDDTYNANPNSVKAAIDVLAELPGQRFLVMGDMAELGDYSLEAHQEVGAFARQQGIDQLIAIGRYASATLAGFGAGGIEVSDFDQAADRLKGLTEDEDVPQTILFKGSRSAGVDQLVGRLTNELAAADPGQH